MGSGIRATSSAPSAGLNPWIRDHPSTLTHPSAKAKTVAFGTNYTSTPLHCKSTVTFTLQGVAANKDRSTPAHRYL